MSQVLSAVLVALASALVAGRSAGRLAVASGCFVFSCFSSVVSLSGFVIFSC